MTKVIKGEFKKLEDLKVEDVLLTCDTSLEEHEADDDMRYDPSDVAFTEWLGSKNFYYKTMDHYTMKALWIYWIRGNDKVELTDEESSDNEDDVAKVFRIDTNIFDYETPLCLAFNEFNYLFKVDPDLLTKDIMGFKTYEDYKDDWIYEWNEDIPWVDEKPWTDAEFRLNLNQSNILASLSTIKLGVRNGQPVVGERMVIVMEEIFPVLSILETRSITKTLNVIMSRGMIVGKDGRAMRFTTLIMMKENVKTKLMKNDMKECVAVKEDEYNDLTITNEEACRAYQEIFRMMDEGWMVTRTE
ncbi:hypothetical protein Tco_0776153 [Tanacetum coccineum]